MAYDEILAGRIRTLLADRDDVTEKRMFGGLAFLVGGHMAVAASGRDVLMVRVDPDSDEPWLADAQPMIMQNRSLAGWRELSGASVERDDVFTAAVRHGVRFAESLPPK